MMYGVDDWMWNPWCRREKTVPAKNCDEIKFKLVENNIPIKYVARHSLFGIRYFELVMKDGAKNVWEEDICKLFDIPKEWVGFTQVKPKTICIKEDELIEKYGNSNGLLSFDFDFIEELHCDCNGSARIVSQLSKNDIECGAIEYRKHRGVIFLRCDNSCTTDIAEALNIPKFAIVNITCESDEYDYIIIEDRCK